MNAGQPPDDVVVLCGGVGAARFLAALALVWPAARTVAVVNTGDDTVLHGLTICPDLDTVVYTLADAIDRDRGWGLRDETWQAMTGLARYTPFAPDGSSAGATWFSLGDRDLATHCYRTARLAEGAPLSAVTAEITAAWHLEQTVVPMSDDEVRTMVTVIDPDGEREVSFQEYFVRRRHDVPVRGVRIAGAERARLSTVAAAALSGARAVVIAPSNPLVSIGPLRALAGVDNVLAARRDQVVAVSPIVGGVALKGPADRMMRDLGMPPTVAGVARLYAPIAGTLVIDPADGDLADEVRAQGMEVVVTPSVMRDEVVGAELARRTLDAAGITV